jgi:hypothetical protein
MGKKSLLVSEFFLPVLFETEKFNQKASTQKIEKI